MKSLEWFNCLSLRRSVTEGRVTLNQNPIVPSSLSSAVGVFEASISARWKLLLVLYSAFGLWKMPTFWKHSRFDMLSREYVPSGNL